jgi:predicted nucleic acid-binding protein
MKVVIDTNVVVSAVVWGGVPGEVLEFVIANEEIQWCVSEQILVEYSGVLSRPKFRLPEAILTLWSQLFAQEQFSWKETWGLSFLEIKRTLLFSFVRYLPTPTS